MIDINTIIVKSFEQVEKAAVRATNTALRRSGAYVRSVAVRSIKKGKLVNGKMIPSKPGNPPFYWDQPGLTFNKSILFAHDAANQTMVVGPIAGRHGKLGALHEFGGSQKIKVMDNGKEKSVMATYPARPFMQPALDKSQDKIAEFWENSIR